MDTEEVQNSSIACTSPAKLLQIRVNTPQCCWVGNPVGGKQEMAGRDKISTMNNKVDKWLDKQHG